MKSERGLFAKTFAVIALILLIFAFVSFALNAIMMHQWGDSARLRPPSGPGPMRGFGFPGMGRSGEPSGPPRPGFPGEMPMVHPSVLTARMIGASAPKDRPKVLMEISRNDAHSGAQYILTDALGNVLCPQGASLPFKWKEVPLPGEDYGYQPVDRKDHRLVRTLVRLEGQPVQYLYVELKSPGALPIKIPLFMFGSLALAILLGAWVSVMVLFRYLRRNMLLVDGVLEDLRGGNLKARLPSGGPNEIRGTTDRFNLMIDEIERLVEHLRNVESSRMILMQELAHDLRTPVASLKNLVETLQRKDESMERALRLELLGLAANEIEYFERLVEDLLMLAQINEPNYRPVRQEVQLNDLLTEAADLVLPPVVSDAHSIRLERNITPKRLILYGDMHLLRRMMRNALDNAYASAKSTVRLSLDQLQTGDVLIRVEDDGPGFPPEIIPLFGEKRIGHSRSQSKDGGLRAGLGSVIMKNIARIHGGSIKAENLLDVSGQVTGARVEMLLPKQLLLSPNTAGSDSF
jgi:signal transduction histidine kinase